LVDELEQVGMYGLARFVNKSIEIIKDKHQYFDVEKEGRFAILLAKSGFLGVTFIKRDLKIRRPDIKATYDGGDVYFEVTRKHCKSCLHRAHQYLMGLRTYIAHPKYSRPYLRYSSWAL